MNDTNQTEAPKRFQCRHIHTEGRRCGSASLRGEEFCYFHHTSRKPVSNPRTRRSRQATFDLPLPEDRGAIQLSIGEVLRRIAANQIDPRRAGLLLYGLQIAAINLPPHKAAANRRERESPVIEEIITDPTHGPVAPPFELPDPDAARKDSLTGRLLAEIRKSREEIEAECRARFEAELQTKPAPIPEPLPEPEPAILPTLNAAATKAATPTPSSRPKRSAVERSLYSALRPGNHHAGCPLPPPSSRPKRSAVERSLYSALRRETRYPGSNPQHQSGRDTIDLVDHTVAELVQIDLSPRKPVRKPEWLKARAPMGETFHNLKKLARELNLHTVCESAQCPNIGECWNHKTATFMMLGNLCTRRCGFCAVPKGKPAPIDHEEPARVAYAVAQLGIAHAVITSVNRDDDNLGAALAFVNVIREIRRQAPGCQVEVLTPDFQGVDQALRMVVEAAPEILNHNIETVPRLYRVAKSGGRYERSLQFLRRAKEIAAEDGRSIVTKTGIIVGMGEEMHELLAVFRDLADRTVDILTVGQYLRPSRDHLPMARFYTPDEFAFLKHEALGMGFRHVESGPLVRSSYHAHEQAQSTGLKSTGLK